MGIIRCLLTITFYSFFLRKKWGIYDYIKLPDRAHMFKVVMPTNRLLLVGGIEPLFVAFYNINFLFATFYSF